MTDLPTPIDVLEFWWNAGPKKWFAGGEAFDGECRDRFLPLLEYAASGGPEGGGLKDGDLKDGGLEGDRLQDWEATPHGTLALLIVLDQLSRNIFRGSDRAFAQDARALAVAKRAIAARFDITYPAPARDFFHMPFMHAEDMDEQAHCCDYFRGIGQQDGYYFALIHMDAIRRFGRFPHRNKVLGRDTTPQEQEYLDSGGFSA